MICFSFLLVLEYCELKYLDPECLSTETQILMADASLHCAVTDPRPVGDSRNLAGLIELRVDSVGSSLPSGIPSSSSFPLPSHFHSCSVLIVLKELVLGLLVKGLG